MGSMNRLGERMAKKPAIPLLVILVVTFASLGMIAYDPPAFNMDEEAFMPDNDITKASTVVSEAFTSSASVMSTIDALGTEGGDMFTKEVFLDVLNYEKNLYAMEYLGTDGISYPYADPNNGFNIMSPVSTVAHVMATAAGFPEPINYDSMIFVVQNATDENIKAVAYMLFNPEGPAAAMALMLTNDAVIEYGTISAKGCVISVVVVDTLVSEITDGMIGFERDVSNTISSLTVDTAGLEIKAVDLNTMMSEIGNMAMDDMSKLIPVALILIVVILLLMYRDFVDMLVGILGLILAIIWTFGISIVLGLEITTIAIAVPILLLGLGIDYGLHLVFRYREERISGHNSEKASGKTVDSVGEALVLATVTTAIAFLSYLTSSMSALASFGAMCAIGIVCAFVVMLLLIPAMQSIRDRRFEKKGIPIEKVKRYKKSESKHGDIIGKVSGIGGRFAAKSPLAVICITCIAMIGFGYSATTLSSEFDMYSFIPENTDASETINYMAENYSMTSDTSSILIYADGWDVDTLRAIEKSMANIDRDQIKGLSYIHGELEDPQYINVILSAAAIADPASSYIPSSEYLAAYGQVFDAGSVRDSATQDMVDVLRSEFYKTDSEGNFLVPTGLIQAMTGVVGSYQDQPVTQIVLKMASGTADDSDLIVSMMNGINAACAEPFGEYGIKAVTTGAAIVLQINLDEMNDSQMSSLILTLALVLIILTIAMYYTDRSWWLGLMSTIPTLVSVILVWGTMALLNIPLNVLTLTIASLTVGMGVTYGIHIAHRFVTDLKDNGCEPREAIMTATRETGKGVFGAALTTAVGFGVIGFSAIAPMQQFGLITALAIAFGYIGAVFILPALLVIWAEHTTPKACEMPKDQEDSA